MEHDITLVIVDDEQYVIDSLTRHIDWDSLGVRITGSATDGMEGLELARKLHPNLIITDVCMPEMDGITMIEHLYQEGLHPYVLIFSAYDDFEYAQRAMRFGVSDYLVKPSLPEEISSALQKMIGRCREEKKRLGEQEHLKQQFVQHLERFQEAFCTALLSGGITTYGEFARQDSYLGMHLLGKKFMVLDIHISPIVPDNEELTVEEQMFKLFQISKYAESLFLVAPRTGKGLGFINNTELMVVAGREVDMEEETLIHYATRLLDFCTNTQNIPVTIALSDIVSEYDQIAGCCKQVKEEIRRSDLINVVVYPRMNRKAEDHELFFSPPMTKLQESEEIIDAVKAGNSQIVAILIHRLFTEMRHFPNPQDLYIYPVLYSLVGQTLSELLSLGIDYDFDDFRKLTENNRTIMEFEQKTLLFFSKLITLVRNTSFTENRQIIQRMMSLVKKRYQEGITLSEIADAMHFSPNYLSTLFAKSTGESFSTFIMKYRIGKAKELLECGQYKIYEIGDMVGYKNPEYFTKVFKEIVGVTPSSYGKNPLKNFE